jgi:hypothetical protein
MLSTNVLGPTPHGVVVFSYAAVDRAQTNRGQAFSFSRRIS